MEFFAKAFWFTMAAAVATALFVVALTLLLDYLR